MAVIIVVALVPVRLQQVPQTEYRNHSGYQAATLAALPACLSVPLRTIIKIHFVWKVLVDD